MNKEIEWDMNDQKNYMTTEKRSIDQNHTQTLFFKSIGRKLFVIVVCEESTVLTELRLMKYNACSFLFFFLFFSLTYSICACDCLSILFLVSLFLVSFHFILVSFVFISFCGHLPSLFFVFYCA